MRRIAWAEPLPTFKFQSAWYVRFLENSVVGVNASGFQGSAAELARCVRKAAIRYSRTHPDGLIECVMVNLSGEPI
jgi:hypothetical protein